MISMRKEKKLWFEILLLFISFIVHLEAEELECTVDVNNLHTEAVLQSPTLRTYMVHVSCRM